MSRASRLLLLFGGGFTPADIPQAEADALVWLYDHTDGANWTDNTGWLSDTTVGNWYGVTVAGGHVTRVQLQSNGLSGNIGNFAVDDLPSLTYLWFYTTSVSGDISGWVLPSTLLDLRFNTTSVSGDISGWTIPPSMKDFRAKITSLSGDLSTLVFPASIESVQLNLTSVTAGPDMSGATGLRDYQIQDCSLSQAAVDAIVQEIYDNWAAYTYATPAVNVGGTNAAPSGTYQDGDPPTTGKEYIYEIVVDPESTGNETWTVTYTA